MEIVGVSKFFSECAFARWKRRKKKIKKVCIVYIYVCIFAYTKPPKNTHHENYKN